MEEFVNVNTMETPQYRMIALKELKLDSNNPRLPKSMHGKTEDDILQYMLLDASLIELMLAIGEKGFFLGEQLLVVKDNIDSKYLVVEGNRRLSAVILLNNPDKAQVQKTKVAQVIKETQQRPRELPCLIFDETKDILNYLGYRHITGIKEWKLLEKARYLYGLREDSFANLGLSEASREIAKVIGSRKDYVKRILVGFQVYRIIEDEAFFKIPNLDDTTFYFNYIADSLNRPNIAAFLNVNLEIANPVENLNKDNLKKWTQWLFQKNDQGKTRLIGDSNDLTSLNLILGNQEALVAFDDGGYSLERAKELTDEMDNQFQNFVKKSLEFIEKADRIVLKIKEFYPTTTDDLKSIRGSAQKIIRTIQDKEAEDEY